MSHVAALCAEGVAGRAVGSKEECNAVAYVTAVFNALELEPYDDSGSWHAEFSAGGLLLGTNVLGSIKGRSTRTRGSQQVCQPGADVVIGAHLDHLGPARDGALRAGADDNASGVAVLMEVARSVREASEALSVSVHFHCYSGEESGLLGSAEVCERMELRRRLPAFMINLDMVGRMRANTLYVAGMQSTPLFGVAVEQAASAAGLAVVPLEGGRAPTDSDSFFVRSVPSLFITTGLHSDYHTSDDIPDALNYDGMVAIVEFVQSLVLSLEGERLPFRPIAGAVRLPTPIPYTGMIFSPSVERLGGVRIAYVDPGSPAESAGVAAGDVVLAFDGQRVASARSLVSRIESTMNLFPPLVFDMRLRTGEGGERTVVICAEMR